MNYLLEFLKEGSLEWRHSQAEEIIFCDNKGNKIIINRLSQNTKYLKRNDFFIIHSTLVDF